MFCFSRANHASTNLKKFSSSKLDKFTLFTHSFVGWNLENRYKEGVSIFLHLSWHFKREKSAVCTAPFCNFATGKNFSFNQCHTKSFAFFSRESYFIKAIENFFSCVCISCYKHSRGWENSRQLCKPETKSRVCITVSNSPNPSRVYIRLCKHEKRFLLLSS